MKQYNYSNNSFPWVNWPENSVFLDCKWSGFNFLLCWKLFPPKCSFTLPGNEFFKLTLVLITAVASKPAVSPVPCCVCPCSGGCHLVLAVPGDMVLGWECSWGPRREGAGGPGAHTVDALPAATLFCTLKLLALPRGFPGMFFPSLQAQVRPSIPSHPAHSWTFRSCIGKMLPCGSKVQREFKHRLLLPSVVIGI